MICCIVLNACVCSYELLWLFSFMTTILNSEAEVNIYQSESESKQDNINLKLQWLKMGIINLGNPYPPKLDEAFTF